MEGVSETTPDTSSNASYDHNWTTLVNARRPQYDSALIWKFSSNPEEVRAALAESPKWTTQFILYLFENQAFPLLYKVDSHDENTKGTIMYRCTFRTPSGELVSNIVIPKMILATIEFYKEPIRLYSRAQQHRRPS